MKAHAATEAGKAIMRAVHQDAGAKVHPTVHLRVIVHKAGPVTVRKVVQAVEEAALILIEAEAEVVPGNNLAGIEKNLMGIECFHSIPSFRYFFNY
jgi:hypothetical protein